MARTCSTTRGEHPLIDVPHRTGHSRKAPLSYTARALEVEQWQA
jgi:hypothetical protein